MDEQALIQGLLNKDEASEKRFFDFYHSKLQHTAAYILGYNDSDIEDVVQETFLAALKDLSKFEFRGAFFPWLRQICVYRCFERIRSRRRQIVNLDEEMDALARRAAIERDQQKATEVDEKVFLEIVREEMGRLGKPCRELLDFRVRQNLSYGELSAKLKIPIGTVMSRLARCKEALKTRVLKAAGRKGILDE